ncbi:MAG: hypothetical protein ACOYNY_26290 [Caldilineaceae bacterium]
MFELITSLKDANIPAFLVVVGVFMIIFALGAKAKGAFEFAPTNRRLTGAVGTLLSTVGMGLFLYQPPSLPSQSSAIAQVTPTVVAQNVEGTATPSTQTVDHELQRISFDYTDELQNHGWFIQRNDLFTLVLEPDGRYGRVLKVISQDRQKAYLEHTISIDAKAGNALEIVAKVDDTTSFYMRAVFVDQSSTKMKEVWLKLTPKPLPTSKQQGQLVKDDEWEFFIEPAHVNDGWKSFSIDLAALVLQGWGEGYALHELKLLRFRGNFSLAYIAIT